MRKIARFLEVIVMLTPRLDYAGHFALPPIGSFAMMMAPAALLADSDIDLPAEVFGLAVHFLRRVSI